MKVYNLVLTTDRIADELFKKAIEHYLPVLESSRQPMHSESCLTGEYSRYVSVVTPCGCQAVQSEKNDAEKTADNGGNRNTGQWTKLEVGMDTSMLMPSSICNGCVEGSTSNLADRLHDLADTIDEAGLIDIIWLTENATGLQIELHLDLYGALARLVDWHNAAVSIVTSTAVCALDARWQQWVDVTRGRFLSCEDFLKVKSSVLWRGAIRLVGSVGTKSTDLIGLEFHMMEAMNPAVRIEYVNVVGNTEPQHSVMENRLLDNHMTFIAEVDLDDIPPFYITHNTYKVCLSSESPSLSMSKTFLTRLKDDPQLCYLVRLRHGLASDAEADKMQTDSTKRWKDAVMESSQSHASLIKERAAYDQHLQHQQSFLIHAEDGDCIAYAMRPLHNLRGAAAHAFAMNELAAGFDVGNHGDVHEAAAELIGSLPCLRDVAMAMRINNEVELFQARVVESWKEERCAQSQDGVLSVDQLAYLLSVSRELCMSKLQDLGWFQNTSAPLHCGAAPHTRPFAADLDGDLERQMLLQRCSSRDGHLSRHASSESLAGFSPPNGNQVVTLTAAEFIKFFTTDGVNVKTDLSPLSVKKGELPQRYQDFENEQTIKASAWPECSKLHYHGIYYNRGDCTDDLEERCLKLKARLRTVETASTCMVEQRPATITVTTRGARSSQAGGNKSSGRATRGKKRLADEISINEKPIAKKSRVVKATVTECSSSQPARQMSSQPSDQMSSQPANQICIQPASQLSSQSASQVSSQPVSQMSSQPASQMSSQPTHKGETRSQRHKRKLEEVIKNTLLSAGLTPEAAIFKPCMFRLFQLTKSFVKDLTTSRHLKQEMEKIAQSHVQQVVTFEQNRAARNTKLK